MDLLMKYSGITAIIVYSAILFLLLSLPKKKKEEKKEESNTDTDWIYERLDQDDEDALVASLVAAIECRKQYHRNVQVIGVRRIS